MTTDVVFQRAEPVPEAPLLLVRLDQLTADLEREVQGATNKQLVIYLLDQLRQQVVLAMETPSPAQSREQTLSAWASRHHMFVRDVDHLHACLVRVKMRLMFVICEESYPDDREAARRLGNTRGYPCLIRAVEAFDPSEHGDDFDVYLRGCLEQELAEQIQAINEFSQRHSASFSAAVLSTWALAGEPPSEHVQDGAEEQRIARFDACARQQGCAGETHEELFRSMLAVEAERIMSHIGQLPWGDIRHPPVFSVEKVGMTATVNGLRKYDPQTDDSMQTLHGSVDEAMDTEYRRLMAKERALQQKLAGRGTPVGQNHLDGDNVCQLVENDQINTSASPDNERMARLMSWACRRRVPGGDSHEVRKMLVRNASSLRFAVCGKLGLEETDAERLARTFGYEYLNDAAHAFDPPESGDSFYEFAERYLTDNLRASFVDIEAAQKESGVEFGAANLGVWALERAARRVNGRAPVGETEQTNRFDAWARAQGFEGADHAALLRAVALPAARRVIWIVQKLNFNWHGFDRPRFLTLEQEGMMVMLECLESFSPETGDAPETLSEKTDPVIEKAVQDVYQRLTADHCVNAGRGIRLVSPLPAREVRVRVETVAPPIPKESDSLSAPASPPTNEPIVFAEPLPLPADPDASPLVAAESLELVQQEPSSTDPEPLAPQAAELLVFDDQEPLPLDPEADSLQPDGPLVLDEGNHPLEPEVVEEKRDDRFIAWARAELGAEAAGCTDAGQFVAALDEKYTNIPKTYTHTVLLKRKTKGLKVDKAVMVGIARDATRSAVRTYDPREHGHFVEYIKAAMEVAIDKKLAEIRRNS